ncbi:hypothetical protein N7455_001421 [Penicillium solitum]|uniref:uncharacterized protein n=1 Tax=Penicillium solitum TaxID=60172 RepID=UPI0032C47947|nr:hypothetical protein N7455_001421 [Penicillium solitum]
MASVASLMPGVRDSTRGSLPDDFLALLEVQAHSIRAACVLSNQINNTAQRSFIELLDNDLDAVEAHRSRCISASLQISILAARLRLYSLPLLSRTSQKTTDDCSDALSKAIWYKGFHIAMRIVHTFAERTQPGREEDCGSTDEMLNIHFPKQYFYALVMAGMYFINLLVIDTNISESYKVLAQNHIKQAYETIGAQSTEERDEASRAAKAIDFLSRHAEAQSGSLELRQPTHGNRSLNIINNGMRMAGQFRSKLRGSGEWDVPENSPDGVSELPVLEDLTELPPWGADLFEWNTWFAGVDDMTAMF